MNAQVAKVHKAYGQMKLWSWVQAGKPLAAAADKYNAHHLEMVDELGRKGVGKVPEKEIANIVKARRKEYYAREKWQDVAEWFGVPGIVLVFASAGFSTSKVAKRRPEFKRNCLEYVSNFLSSIKGLVDILGPDVLDRYDCNGQLSDDYTSKIKDYEGFVPDESLFVGDEDSESHESEPAEDSS